VNDRLVKDGYEAACALSDLQTRFLHESVSSVANRLLKTRVSTPPSTEGVRNSARQPLAKKTRAAAAEKAAPASWRAWPWRQFARAGAAVFGVVVALALVNVLVWEVGSLGSDELEGVSPFLSSGVRNGEGSGPAFVGAINDDWFELDAAEQVRAAAVLVQGLRERGVREIMIYDDDGRLHIQALGDEPPRVVSASDG
jgi:predicted small integral membrane protein